MKNLEKEQLKLAKKVVKKDSFEEINIVGGIDKAYIQNKIICSIVLVDKEFNIIEKKTSMSKLKFPYIPGFLGYREAPAILETFEKLENRPDLLFIHGNGILHPRKFGLASHIGISLDIPTIGITKKLIKPAEVKEGKCYIKDEVLGEELHTREGSNPIYVSIGNRVSLNNAVKFVKDYIKENKLPFPMHEAHKLANKSKKSL